MQFAKQYYSALNRGVVGPSIPLPDQIFSLRLVNPAYLGDCIEVRRSSDNISQNIGFLGGVLDTSSLLSFVGVGDGFIRTWYNQNGADNLTQTSNNSFQPKIVSSGSLITLNSKPSILFDGTDDRLNGSQALLDKVNSTRYSALHYVRKSSKTGGQILMPSNNSGSYGMVTQDASTTLALITQWVASGLSGNARRNYYGIINGVLDPYSVAISSVQRNETHDLTTGTSIVSEVNCGFTNTVSTLILGFYSGFVFSGECPEILIYNGTDLDSFIDTSVQESIHSFINDYFSIY